MCMPKYVQGCWKVLNFGGGGDGGDGGGEGDGS